MDSVLTVIVSTTVSFAVVGVSHVLSPAWQSRRERRPVIHGKFDTAVAALLEVQAARHYPDTVPDSTGFQDVKSRQEHELELRVRGLEELMRSTHAARVALADVAVFVPEARAWLVSDWELTEVREPTMKDVLESRRDIAAKAERLFREPRR